MSANVAVGVLRDSRNFSGHPYNGAHRAVILAACSSAFLLYKIQRVLLSVALSSIITATSAGAMKKADRTAYDVRYRPRVRTQPQLITVH